MTVSSTGTTTTTTSYGGTPVIQFSGLASGLDTTSIITELMQVEAQPQNALKSRMAAEQSQVTALQTLNSSFAALSTAAQSFENGSTWTQLTTSSSDSAISVTASSSAVPASVSVVVNALARGAQYNLGSAPAAVTTYTVYGADGTTALMDSSGNAVTFTPKDSSLSALADAINATTSQSNLKAVLINPAGANGTTPMLEIVSTATGVASNFKITDGTTTLADTTVPPDPTVTPPVVIQGQDASISVDNQVITSSTNTFKNAMQGVDITLGAGAKLATPATVSVTDDGSARASAVGLFVQQMNTLLQNIASATAYGSISTTAGAASTGGGALAGNSDLRDLATRLVNTIFPPDGTSMADYGLSVDKGGAITFDTKAFTAAYQADPDKVQAAFVGTPASTNADGTVTAATQGFAQRVQALADLASNPGQGVGAGILTAAINSMNDEISNYSDQISAWDDRLAAKQASLETIYTNLETKLSQLQSQQSWLSGQLDSLDSGWMQNNQSGG